MSFQDVGEGAPGRELPCLAFFPAPGCRAGRSHWETWREFRHELVRTRYRYDFSCSIGVSILIKIPGVGFARRHTDTCQVSVRREGQGDQGDSTSFFLRGAEETLKALTELSKPRGKSGLVRVLEKSPGAGGLSEKALKYWSSGRPASPGERAPARGTDPAALAEQAGLCRAWDGAAGSQSCSSPQQAV